MRVKFSSLLVAVIIGLYLATLSAALLTDGGIPWDYKTVLAATGYFVGLLVLTLVGSRLKSPLLLILVFGSLSTIGQAILGLMVDAGFFPSGLLSSRSLSASEFTKAVIVATVGSLVLGIGIVVGSLLLRGRRQVSMEWDIPKSYRTILLAVSSSILGIAGLLTATGVKAMGSRATGQWAFLGTIFDEGLALILLVSLPVFAGERLSRSEKFAVGILLLFYVSLKLWQGSRGGVAHIGIVAVVALVARDWGDFSLNARWVAFLGAVGLLTVFVVWPAGTAVRRAEDPADLGRLEEGFGNFYRTYSDRPFGPLTAPMDRQSQLPQLIVIVNDWGPALQEDFSADGIPRHILAGLLPNSLYTVDQETYPRLAAYYPQEFKGVPEKAVHSEGWTPIASAWFLSGDSSSALVLLGATGLFISSAYGALSRLPSFLRSPLCTIGLLSLGYGLLIARLPSQAIPEFIRRTLVSILILGAIRSFVTSRPFFTRAGGESP